ncbi:NitT/TauT family transport system substrate-binding protein [Cohaesibacter marisflavi]|uniref:NitT/TauT family transport system substrate-binding protein n=1 Tax=Cohaesibacter marisflavi TaxID=655353 RepID=A0A1I5IJH8_9HYPH|nr:PhnD/SsuA/transferrin family substrate-binding protein [Cohaesibacter marisflavi]SFO60788.1 NitT/TauT family transport system substrate-binding protein [Cohaesibacter marisflavi]
MFLPSDMPLERRSLLKWAVGLAIAGAPFSLGGLSAKAASGGLTLWGIPASPSAVFARAVASGALEGIAPDLRFDVWKSTDQMRAGIASGDFKLFATSTYAAANFFNRGAGTVMLNVVTWGVLYVMAREEGITRIEDLAGKRVLLSNKNEAPDLLFRLVLMWAGLDPDKDVTLDYVGSPGEAVPLYLSGRGDVAVLHEPASTAALFRAQKAGLPLYRAIDITKVYGAHTGRGPRIPQVGLAVNPAFLEEKPEVVAAVHQACVEAGEWTKANWDEAGKLAAQSLPLPAPVIAQSLPYVHLDVQSAKEARADIELYFEHLMSLDPGIVGGRKPTPDFYWG